MYKSLIRIRIKRDIRALNRSDARQALLSAHIVKRYLPAGK